eukprot:5329192-Pleurochrysis_carterae.AAC.1
MMRLHFEKSGAVAGAFIKTYLLEKSRAVAITDPERNYHVFYQLMASAPDEHKGAHLSKLKPEQVHMINQVRRLRRGGVRAPYLRCTTLHYARMHACAPLL